eukprot:1161196-Prorocentrum_minimum.AAC.1
MAADFVSRTTAREHRHAEAPRSRGGADHGRGADAHSVTDTAVHVASTNGSGIYTWHSQMGQEYTRGVQRLVGSIRVASIEA